MPAAQSFRTLVLASLCFATPLAAHASPVDFTFQASLDTGALAGTHFTGTASYDSTGSSGVGTEYLTLTSLNFSLLGELFTRADISQGGQAILEDGTLSYFTAAFFPSGPGPVNDLAFGFGGPGIIGYSVPPGFNPGAGSYTVQITSNPIPEPPTLVLCTTAVASLLTRTRLRTRRLRSRT